MRRNKSPREFQEECYMKIEFEQKSDRKYSKFITKSNKFGSLHNIRKNIKSKR